MCHPGRSAIGGPGIGDGPKPYLEPLVLNFEASNVVDYSIVRAWLMTGSTPIPRPKWSVSCRNCSGSITHSYVGKTRRIEDYLRPTDPEFPPGGLELTCPHCKTTALYKPSDVRYQLK
jgi:hypothetical protein